MTPVFQRDGVRIFHGDCRDVLKAMPEGSINCCVTSPPYWSLRDYGNPPSVWGGDAACEHEWNWRTKPGITGNRDQDGKTDDADGCTYRPVPATSNANCLKCGAWLGCYGLEPTPEMFVEHTVEIFREVARVLHSSGTLWLNLGDSYCSTAPGTTNAPMPKGSRVDPEQWANFRPETPAGLKPKDLCMIPWRVFLALQADGWWLRSIICWAKRSPMPESVTDRPTNSWEPIALLTRNAKYFYDVEAVKEEALPESVARCRSGFLGSDPVRDSANHYGDGFQRGEGYELPSRNMRNVWHLGPEPYPDAHFATFPTEIPRRAIKAGTSEHGCCPACRAPYRRLVDKTKVTRERPNEYTKRTGEAGTGNSCANTVAGVASRTIGWEPTCKCNAGDPVPCRVLDPFFGSGTTGEVAQELGCECDGIELNPDYIKLAEKRFRQRTFLVGA